MIFAAGRFVLLQSTIKRRPFFASCCAAVIFHFVFITWVFTSQEGSYKVQEIKKASFKVLTVNLQPKKMPCVDTNQKVKKSLVKKAAEKPKKNAQKVKAKKNTTVERKTLSQKNAKLKGLVKTLKQDLAKIEKSTTIAALGSTSNREVVNSMPSKIGSLTVDALNLSGSETEKSYINLLSDALKRQLKLPEDGEVKIRLVVARGGDVRDLLILRSMSCINQTYVQQNLPRTLLPPFNHYFKGQSQHTFEITLKSK